MFKESAVDLNSAFYPYPALYSQSAVCILHSVCILPLVRSLRFALTVLLGPRNAADAKRSPLDERDGSDLQYELFIQGHPTRI